MSEQQWTQFTVHARKEDLDTVCAVMSMLDSGLWIDDPDDIVVNGVYGDLLDDSLLQRDPTKVSVSIFVPTERNPAEYRAFLTERFASLSVSVEMETVGVSEEDWAESWKQYYKPVHLGRVTIVPAWEKYTPSAGEIIVRMDPGMAFGTGTHETTRLVILLTEKYLQAGGRVLDVGCGSGILSICASKLGAGFCHAYDIDPVAVRVARDNVASDGVTNVHCDVSNLLADVDVSQGGYDLILANIVSDIILRMLPDAHRCLAEHGKMIFSGIIAPRKQEVIDGLTAHGYRVIDVLTENDWVALVAERA